MEPQTDGETAAKQILQTVVRDFGASEVHFEPLPGGAYRVRVRDADGKLHVISGENIAEAKKFLVQNAAEEISFTIGDTTVRGAVAVLPTPDGDRVRVAFLSHEAVSLSDLPMRGNLREGLEALLEQGRITGGVLFVSGGNRDRLLKNRTIDAIRGFVSDDDTIILDDTYAKRSDRINAQRPDVLVCYDLVTKQTGISHVHLSQLHGVLVVVASQSRFFGKSLYPATIGVLTINPLAPDGSNATNRYELQTADELYAALEKGQAGASVEQAIVQAMLS